VNGLDPASPDRFRVRASVGRPCGRHRSFACRSLDPSERSASHVHPGRVLIFAPEQLRSHEIDERCSGTHQMSAGSTFPALHAIKLTCSLSLISCLYRSSSELNSFRSLCVSSEYADSVRLAVLCISSRSCTSLRCESTSWR
jgi:hypothetical protein